MRREGSGVLLLSILLGLGGVASATLAPDLRGVVPFRAVRVRDVLAQVPPFVWVVSLAGGALALALTVPVRQWWRARQRDYQAGVRLGSRTGRAEVVHEVRMLAHAHLKTQVVDAERRLAQALAAHDPAQQRLALADTRASLARLRQQIVALHDQATPADPTGPTVLPGDLEQTLGAVTRTLSGTGVRGVLEVAGMPHGPIPAAVTRALEAILYNALANATRHGHATTLHVQLIYALAHVTLTISDNGRGFDPARRPRVTRGRGLTDMQRLADRLQGTCDVTSQPGQGTTVTVTVPLPAPPLGWASGAAAPHRTDKEAPDGRDPRASSAVGAYDRPHRTPAPAPTAHPGGGRHGPDPRPPARSALPPWVRGDPGSER